ncbi:MAG: RIP metalloprotease RseP [Bacteroidaceae bacterium]|nr:RIP metalloprotease RseP [Bacteroidaceae bacterium]
METVLIKTLQLLCCLSLLVVLHEGGHFGFAKLFGVKVEKFFMFFDYKFHLFSTKSKWFTRLFPHFKDNETEYGIGWIPLGGYVKIAGMIDESMDTEQMKQPAQPNEFRSQKVWKRFLIMFGGVLMNLITAWVIYSLVLLAWGRDYYPMTNIEQGFQYNEQAHNIGFLDGDIPIRTNKGEIKEYSLAVMRTISNAKTVTVMRQGQEVELTMPEEGLSMLKMMQSQPQFLQLLAEAYIDSVVPGSVADKAGIEKGMRLMAVNGKDIKTWADFDHEVTLRREDVLSSPDCTAQDSIKWRTLDAVFASADGTHMDTVSLQLDEKYMMGVTRHIPDYKTVHLSYNLANCFPAGLSYGWRVLKSYVNDLKYVASAEGAKSVGSFITIGNIFPSAWNWQQFWMLTAFISIILAVMNILPIPGLDGGHIVLLFYEGITGRQPSDKAMEWIEKIGIFIIIALMVLALSNDVRNFILPLFGL